MTVYVEDPLYDLEGLKGSEGVNNGCRDIVRTLVQKITDWGIKYIPDTRLVDGNCLGRFLEFGLGVGVQGLPNSRPKDLCILVACRIDPDLYFNDLRKVERPVAVLEVILVESCQSCATVLIVWLAQNVWKSRRVIGVWR